MNTNAKEIIKLIIMIGITFLVVFATTEFVVKPVVVSGESMENTYKDGQYQFVNRLSYHNEDPQRGDVIVFEKDKGELLIKRVIGLPGETIEVRDGQTYINGKLFEEPYTKEPLMYDDMEPVTVYEDTYFVMGDNRNNSLDSREFGAIGKSDILGKIFSQRK